MRTILTAAGASVLAMNFAFAQTAAQTAAPATPPTTSMGAPPSATPMTNSVHNDKAAASGDTNQAVVTTGANADQPAHGHNSFTKGQARNRIAKKGYSHVTDLAKDSNGVWRGTGTKDGQPIQVWLDYKGNVGQAS